MSQVVTVINQKGGVGKTTTAHALAAGLKQRGYRVLSIDTDPQCNLSFTAQTGPGLTSYEMLVEGHPAIDCIQQTPLGDVIPASPALTHADTLITGKQREYTLQRAVEPIIDRYDWIVVDTPPALGIITINALTASTNVIVTAQADSYSLQALSRLHETLEAVREISNPALSVTGILITRLKSRTIIGRDLSDLIGHAAERLNTTRFKTAIREITAIQEAQANQTDIFTYQPRSKAAKDYGAFVDEFLKRSKKA